MHGTNSGREVLPLGAPTGGLDVECAIGPPGTDSPPECPWRSPAPGAPTRRRGLRPGRRRRRCRRPGTTGELAEAVAVPAPRTRRNRTSQPYASESPEPADRATRHRPTTRCSEPRVSTLRGWWPPWKMKLGVPSGRRRPRQGSRGRVPQADAARGVAGQVEHLEGPVAQVDHEHEFGRPSGVPPRGRVLVSAWGCGSGRSRRSRGSEGAGRPEDRPRRSPS